MRTCGLSIKTSAKRFGVIRRVVLLLPLVIVCLGTGCSSVRKDYPKIPSYALSEPVSSPILNQIATQLARHPEGHSGFRLLALSSEALAARIMLADQAVATIDFQYYIFHDDPTGRLVAQRLLAAADRGVRVRILLDDNHIVGNDRDLLVLDQHPNIEVRIFNPFKNRIKGIPFSTVSIATQWLIDGRRLNRRMHNKSFIVDNQIAIIGGRNIGDEYFDARQDINFRDLDVMTIGSISQQISASFDTFWNSPAAYPLAAFYAKSDSDEALEALRQDLAKNARSFPEYTLNHGLFTRDMVALAATLEDDDDDDDDQVPPGQRIATSTSPNNPSPASFRYRWRWGQASLIADTPDKTDPTDEPKGPHIGDFLSETLGSTQKELLLITPYFVPRDAGVDLFKGLTAEGVTVKILTNSLASTDVSIVHSGYSRYRKKVLEAGVELYELVPLPPVKRTVFSRSKAKTNVSLHAKAFVIDGKTTFIGSLNLDPRSELLNTEMGVLVSDPGLAQDVARFFEEATDADTSYKLHLNPPDAHGKRSVYWTCVINGETVTYTSDPKASFWRQFKNIFFRMFPIEGLL